MARLTEPRFATAGKFVPMKFREDSLPITESERLFKKNGSQFPPSSLEPLPYERERVAERMSPEDRLRRKQWMEDQKIPKGEPRMEIMEKIKPTNAFRRFYQTPGKQLEGLFTSVTSPWNAKNWRLLCTRLFRGYIVGLGLVYWIKYNSMSWEKRKGTVLFMSDADDETKDMKNQDSHEFADFGFKERTVLRQ